MLSPWVASAREGRLTKRQCVALFPTGFKSLWTLSTTCASIETPPVSAVEVVTLSDEEMEALKSQTQDDAYPLMPYPPVVVAAASCEDIVLRWRSVDDDTKWPIEGYVVQRFPDANHKLEWETLLDATNASDATDKNVHTSQQYLYRVQAVSGGARSTYAYHTVTMNQSTCYASTALIAYLPEALHSIPYISSLSLEAVQTFVLIISCFLAVFGVVRSNVKRVQHTQSRQGRLREMKKATMAESSKSLYALPRRSSSEASTDPSTSITELLDSSQTITTSSSNRSIPLDHSDLRARSDSTPRAASFSVTLQKHACHYCHKKFGLFRRRRVCDVCETVTLCRKCGSQAPVDGSVAALRESLHNRASDAAVSRPRVMKSNSSRVRRVKTLCRDCCDEAERFSTSFLPSTARPLR